MAFRSFWGRYYFAVDLGIITGLLCFYSVAPYRFFAKDSVTTGSVWSPAVHLARALWYGRLGKSLHRGDPLLIGKLKVRRIRYVKLYGMLLPYAFFFENEFVVHGWCEKKGNFSPPDIYISHTKSLKNLSRFFPNLKLLDTFDCVGHLATNFFWWKKVQSLGIYKKFLVTLLFQSLVLRVKKAWLRTLSIRYGRYITQQRL